MTARIRIAYLMLIVLVVMAACTKGQPENKTPGVPPTGQASGDVVVGQAKVDRVELALLESFPVQVKATAYGNLPDGCTTISRVDQEREGNTITVTIQTSRPKDEACTMALVPYQETINIDAVGLKAGKYAVNVNGVAEEFELSVDNVLK